MYKKKTMSSGYESDPIAVWIHTQERYALLPEFASVKYSNPPVGMEQLQRRFAKTNVRFVKKDMIDEAIEIFEMGVFGIPLVLNMADWNNAGGSVDVGSMAQEEECFRRSNYFKTLLQSFYPLGELDTIISKGVEYYRKGAADEYVFMDKPIKLDMIAQAAVRYPATKNNGTEFSKTADVTRFENKVRMLLSVAADAGNEVLILSAWGCGEFRCPPEAVARIFRRIIEAEYNGVFREIVFAIIGLNYDRFQKGWLSGCQQIK